MKGNAIIQDGEPTMRFTEWRLTNAFKMCIEKNVCIQKNIFAECGIF